MCYKQTKAWAFATLSLPDSGLADSVPTLGQERSGEQLEKR